MTIGRTCGTKNKMQIIDGKKIRDKILVEVKNGVASLPFQPIFCDVLVGDDPASLQYVQMKKVTAENVGMAFHQANFPSTITTDDLIKEIKILNKIPKMCGIIVQLPLPAHLDRQAILDSIDPKIDVDCLGKVASEKFYNGDAVLGYPTALACLAILETLPLNLTKKNIVVLGQGILVGRPVASLLRTKGLQPSVINKETENQKYLLREADVIISGIGQGKYIEGEMIKSGVVLIDAGSSESGSGIVGDVDLESVKNIAGYVSPVPGGIGPVTVAMLLQNVLTVAKSISN